MGKTNQKKAGKLMISTKSEGHVINNFCLCFRIYLKERQETSEWAAPRKEKRRESFHSMVLCVLFLISFYQRYMWY